MYDQVSATSDPSAQEMKVAPNPNTGFFTIRTPKPMDRVLITDLLGRSVLESSPGLNTAEFRLSMPGWFYVMVQTNGQISVQKLLVTKP